MIDLLKQYKEARKGLMDMIAKLGNSERDREDKRLLNSMKNEVEYIIKWLEFGYDIENPQGVNIRDAYNVEKYENMDVFPDLNEQLREEREKLHDLTPEQRKIIIKVINSLSDRERDCFLLRVQGLTMQQIADELDISLWTVRTYLDRANDKIKEIVK